VVLGIASLDLALVQHCGTVLGKWSGHLTGRFDRYVGPVVQVAENDREVAESVRDEVGGQLNQCGP
jgi:hypothetical protein